MAGETVEDIDSILDEVNSNYNLTAELLVRVAKSDATKKLVEASAYMVSLFYTQLITNGIPEDKAATIAAGYASATASNAGDLMGG